MPRNRPARLEARRLAPKHAVDLDGSAPLPPNSADAGQPAVGRQAALVHEGAGEAPVTLGAHDEGTAQSTLEEDADPSGRPGTLAP